MVVAASGVPQLAGSPKTNSAPVAVDGRSSLVMRRYGSRTTWSERIRTRTSPAGRRAGTPGDRRSRRDEAVRSRVRGGLLVLDDPYVVVVGLPLAADQPFDHVTELAGSGGGVAGASLRVSSGAVDELWPFSKAVTTKYASLEP